MAKKKELAKKKEPVKKKELVLVTGAAGFVGALPEFGRQHRRHFELVGGRLGDGERAHEPAGDEPARAVYEFKHVGNAHLRRNAGRDAQPVG